MLDLIVLIPGFWAAYLAYAKTPAQAYLYAYLPALFLLPDSYRCVFQGLPDPTFSEFAVLPVAIAYVFKEKIKWTYSITDFLVLGYAFCVSWSQYLATDLYDAQNLIFDMMGKVILPYALTKALVEPKGNRIVFAKCLIVYLMPAVLMELYELFLMVNPYRQVFDTLLAYYTGSTQIRYGLGRASGPFGHAILCGVIMATGILIQRWLEKEGHWGSRKKGRLITSVIVLGSVMSISRGPWIALVTGSAIPIIGYAKKRLRALLIVLVVGVAVGTPFVTGLQDYVSVKRLETESQDQENAAYRRELIDVYQDTVLEKPVWGWGRAGWPVIAGMYSIDNQFLLLALDSGFISLGFFIAIILATAIRLIVYCVRSPRTSDANTLAFTLLAVLVAIVVSIGTVYMGSQVMPLFFIICGWSDALVAVKEEGKVVASEALSELQPLFRFRRVLT